MELFDGAGRLKVSQGGGDPVTDVLGAGVVGAGDGAITRNSSSSIGIAAGSGWIRQSSGALLRVTWSAATISSIPAAGTNPRVDLFSVNSDGTVSRTAGTEQASATLDNAAGTTSRQAIPANSLLLGEALVKTSGGGIIGSSRSTDYRDLRRDAKPANPLLVAQGIGAVPWRLDRGTLSSSANTPVAIYTCPPNTQGVITSCAVSIPSSPAPSRAVLYVTAGPGSTPTSMGVDAVGSSGIYSSQGDQIIDPAAHYYRDIQAGTHWIVPRRGPIVLNPGQTLWADHDSSAAFGYTLFGYETPVGLGYPKQLGKGTTHATPGTTVTAYTCSTARALVWSTPIRAVGNISGTPGAFLYLNGTAVINRVRRDGSYSSAGPGTVMLDPGCVSTIVVSSGTNDQIPVPPLPMNNGDVLYISSPAASSGYAVFGVEF